MHRDQGARVAAAVIVLGTMLLLPGAPSGASGEPAGAATAGSAAELEAERLSIDAWRAGRILRLTSDSGWLTLAGLFWLKEGDNSFGRASSNALVLDNASLADTAGSFMVTGERVRFLARPGAGVTHDGRAVTSLDLASDARGEPTMLASGALRFFVIERAGNLGVRVRDLDNPHRRNFGGLSYFPVSTDWVFNARFEPYEPAHHLQIVNILGMEEEAQFRARWYSGRMAASGGSIPCSKRRVTVSCSSCSQTAPAGMRLTAPDGSCTSPCQRARRRWWISTRPSTRRAR